MHNLLEQLKKEPKDKIAYAATKKDKEGKQIIVITYEDGSKKTLRQ